ncbi:hypothetical protein EBO15_06700 [Actinomadura harenae]|uniref:Uncharacterized protein n=1 Tax=Actinomadura harenae TaxID=2483351 RepID=A0A3M2MAU1_9ACTN|nr:hypothetical protein EBO15_06700 [Actinomadura harenae]
MTVLVEKKRPKALISRRRLLPDTVTIDGVRWGVDVVEAGPAPTLGAGLVAPDGTTTLAGPIDAAFRPPRQGCGISNQVTGNVTATYGATVIDLTDNAPAMLTAAHAVGRSNQAKAGESIIQPGFAANAGTQPIGTLKRYVPLQDGTEVDAALAGFASGIGNTTAVANDLMPEISPTHPAVGMTIAGNNYGFCYLTVAETTRTQLNFKFPNATSASNCTKAPTVGMKLEKVGRTSAYSSGTVMSIGNTIKVDAGSPVGQITIKNVIFVPFFSLLGDSGSIACEGGDGKTYPDFGLIPCPLLGTIGSYYGFDLTSENALADQLRDSYLMQSPVGRLLIQGTYMNSQMVKDRLAGKTPTTEEQYYAQQFHTRYRDFIANVITDPTSTATVTEQHLRDTVFIMDGLSQSVLTAEEAKAAWTMYDQVLVKMLGMNRTQMIAFMNNDALAQQVYTALKAVPTVDMTPSAPFE